MVLPLFQEKVAPLGRGAEGTGLATGLSVSRSSSWLAAVGRAIVLIRPWG